MNIKHGKKKYELFKKVCSIMECYFKVEDTNRKLSTEHLGTNTEIFPGGSVVKKPPAL